MRKTEKYNLNLIEETDVISPDPINENTQTIEDNIKEAFSKLDKITDVDGKLYFNGNKVGETDSDKISVNVEGIESDNVQDAIDELSQGVKKAFQYADDGKRSIVSAIVGLGGTANDDMTFDELTTSISSLRNIRKRQIIGNSKAVRGIYQIDYVNVTEIIKSLPFIPRFLFIKNANSTIYNYNYILICNIQGWITLSSNQLKFDHYAGNKKTSLIYHNEFDEQYFSKVKFKDPDTNLISNDQVGIETNVVYYAIE